VKTEADASITDITECSHDDKPTVGMFGLSFNAVRFDPLGSRRPSYECMKFG